MTDIESIRFIFDYWQKIMAHPKSRLDIKRETAIRSRLKDGFTAEDICQAIRGCACSEFHMGVNERRTEYNSITLICRDSDHIEKFMSFGETADRLIADIAERKEQVQVQELPPPPSAEQIARAREMMKTVKLRRVA